MADDFSELYQLAADLEDAPDLLPPYLRRAIQGTAFLVKKDAQDSVRTRNGFGHAANAITYDTRELSGGVYAEIGYDKNRAAGSLGNLIEYGAPNAKKHILVNGRNVPVPGDIPQPLAPSHDLGNALLNNADDFERGIMNAVSDAMEERDL